METIRQQKVAKQLQKDIADIFFKQNLTVVDGTMVTVMDAEVSPDLGVAKIYISVFPSAKGEEILKVIRSKDKVIRHEVGKKVRHQLRIVPEFIYYLDHTLDRVEEVEKVLKNV